MAAAAGQPEPVDQRVADFLARWKASEAAERANCQSFLTKLCQILGVPVPDPAQADVAKNAYVFERDVTFQNPDGSQSVGRIDLYKRGCFVLEAKQGSIAPTVAPTRSSKSPGPANAPYNVAASHLTPGACNGV